MIAARMQAQMERGAGRKNPQRKDKHEGQDRRHRFGSPPETETITNPLHGLARKSISAPAGMQERNLDLSETVN